MKRFFGILLISSAFLNGCGENAPPSMDAQPPMQNPAVSSGAGASATSGGLDQPVAFVAGQPLSLNRLVQPLIEAHGLTMLLNLTQLELAKQDAVRNHLVVTDKDFEEERDLTLEKLCKDADESQLIEAVDKAVASKDQAAVARAKADLRKDREEFLTQFLLNQHIDPVEFNLVLQINTYLRKIAEPQIKGQITDAALHRAFGQMYGEKVKVQYMELGNLDEVGIAKRRLAAGERFEDVARDMSRNRTSGALGGDLPAFSRQSTAPARAWDAFKEMSFNLKDGEVSDPLSYGNDFVLIKRINLIPPKAVSFDKEKQFVYDTLHANLLDLVIKKLKQELAAQVVTSIKFADPNSVLARQYEDRSKHVEKEAAKRVDANLERVERLRQQLRGESAATEPATAPAGAPPAGAGTAPAGAAPEAATAPAGERPPATEPGSASTFLLPKLVPDTQPATLPATNK